jgi:hypothetical protein
MLGVTCITYDTAKLGGGTGAGKTPDACTYGDGEQARLDVPICGEPRSPG